jgi:hypothetical protein
VRGGVAAVMAIVDGGVDEVGEGKEVGKGGNCGCGLNFSGRDGVRGATRCRCERILQGHAFFVS